MSATSGTPAEQAAPPAAPLSLGAYFISMGGYPKAARRAAFAVLISMGLSPVVLMTLVTFVVAPISQQTGWSRSSVMSMFSLPMLIGALTLPVTGRFVDRWGARRVAFPMMTLYGLATVAIWASGTHRALLQTALIISATAGFSASLGVGFKVVAAWFTDHRGAGFSLLLGSAVGLFSAVLAPVGNVLVESVGWRATYLLIGLVILLVGLPAQILLLREAPAVLHPRGADSILLGADEARDDGPSAALSTAVRSRSWVLYTALLALSGGATMAVRSNAEALLTPHGVSTNVIALSLSALLVSSIVGQALVGFSLDRSRSSRVIAPFVLCTALGLLLVAAGGQELWLLFVGMCLLGLATGAESSMGPFLSARYFGLRSFGQIQGLTMALTTTANTLAPVLAAAELSRGLGSGALLTALAIASGIAVAMVFLLPGYPTADGPTARAPGRAPVAPDRTIELLDHRS
ncbi:MFS transporter [Streptomyces sp. cg40]|uniref:MFS transporter n=1 Tax=Streptomyces sp. cg40 TaxID=3419764 RepID=UPI003CFD94EB